MVSFACYVGWCASNKGQEVLKIGTNRTQRLVHSEITAPHKHFLSLILAIFLHPKYQESGFPGNKKSTPRPLWGAESLYKCSLIQTRPRQGVRNSHHRRLFPSPWGTDRRRRKPGWPLAFQPEVWQSCLWNMEEQHRDASAAPSPRLPYLCGSRLAPKGKVRFRCGAQIHSNT